ncbi:hypothetical protein GCM10010145_61500 [Streptomyces ruber]|uniref:Uncharacterized protein n=1 Tax=Streptomyces ruber TaxID=83378 RepID=A0A918EYS6_9ACTN|nr:hypothetical protein GCM10010145_61500 [Streptomyces ruber]
MACPVATTVEPVPVGPPRGCGNGGDTAQPREGRLGPQPLGVVARADQQLAGGLRADPGQRDEPRRGLGDQGLDLGFGLLDLIVEYLVAAGQAPQGGPGRVRGVGRVTGGAGAGQGVDQLASNQAPDFLP